MAGVLIAAPTAIMRAAKRAGHPLTPVMTGPRARTAMLSSGSTWRPYAGGCGLRRSGTHRSEVSIAEHGATPVALVEREQSPALHDLLSGALVASGQGLIHGIPFTGVESTFAEMATHPIPMWPPIFGYEAEHAYDDIRVLAIEPALTIPVHVVAGPMSARRSRRRCSAHAKARISSGAALEAGLQTDPLSICAYPSRNDG